jgi:hypothetical protein
MTDVTASVAEEFAVAFCVPVVEMMVPAEKASVDAEVLGDANAFPYPVPAVHVPDPLSLPKYANTNSFAEVVGPEVETVPIIALGWKFDPIWSSTEEVNKPDTSEMCRCRLLVPVMWTVTVSGPVDGTTA